MYVKYGMKEPECFGWKDTPYETTPKHIYLMNKTCLSCFYYHECYLESEDKVKKLNSTS